MASDHKPAGHQATKQSSELYFSIGSDDSLVPPGNKLLHESILMNL